MAKKSIKGVWLSISQIDMKFATKGIFINNLFKRVVGIEKKHSFGRMLGVVTWFLKDLCLNLYALEENKNCLLMGIINFNIDLGQGEIGNSQGKLERGERKINSLF